MNNDIHSLTGPALRDAKWVLSFGAGQEWLDGDASGFRANRLAELKAAGVLVPGREGILKIGDATL